MLSMQSDDVESSESYLDACNNPPSFHLSSTHSTNSFLKVCRDCGIWVEICNIDKMLAKRAVCVHMLMTSEKVGQGWLSGDYTVCRDQEKGHEKKAVSGKHRNDAINTDP